MGSSMKLCARLPVPADCATGVVTTGACEGFARAPCFLEAEAPKSRSRSAAEEVEDDVPAGPFKELALLRLLCSTAGAARIWCTARPGPGASSAGEAGDAELVRDALCEEESINDGEVVRLMTCWSEFDIA